MAYSRYKDTHNFYIWSRAYDFLMQNKKSLNKSILRYRENGVNVSYYNLPLSFDIETTNFKTKDGVELAYCYIWQFDFDGYVFFGRSIQEFKQFVGDVKNALGLSDTKKIICYVHNLDFEMQFIKKLFKWTDIFALSEYKPIKATIADYGVEFRCSYKLSNLSLETLSELTDTNKKVGDLDYSLLRNSKTKLSSRELGYCFSDVEVVVEYIREMLGLYENLHKIPMTSTGKVRQAVKKKVLSSAKYRNKIKYAPLTCNEFLTLKRAFQGGFTHANAENVGEIIRNVYSYDLTSSYPAVMCYEKEFPASKGLKTKVKNKRHFEYLLEKYCVIFDVHFSNIHSKTKFEHYISLSKCSDIVNPIVDNGRVVSADELTITLTNIDFEIIKRVYSYNNNIKLGNVYTYKKGYLPKELIEQVLDWFAKKTELKGIKSEEKQYNLLKTYINSLYGMAVTAIDKPIVTLNNENYEWESKPKELKHIINEYNGSTQRFLCYQWGIYITALARRTLWRAILALGNDYRYSDTDSVKFVGEYNKVYFEKTNKEIENKLLQMCSFYNIDPEKIYPKNSKNKVYILGLWDFEGEYKLFKTLGAKRYIYMTSDNKTKITLAGLGKRGKDFLIEKYGKYGVFEQFKNSMSIEADKTGKLTHKYIDTEYRGIELVDYQGNKQVVDVLSCVYLTGAPFSLSISKQFLKYLYGIQEESRGI